MNTWRRNLLRGVCQFALMVCVGQLISWAFLEGILEIGYWLWPVTVGIILTGGFVPLATKHMVLVVPDKEVWAAVDTLFGKTDVDGFPIYTFFRTGLNLKWWWQTIADGDKIRLERDVIVSSDPKKKFETSDKAEMENIDDRLPFRPDIDNLQEYVRNGKTETDREKNLTNLLRGQMHRSISMVFARNQADNIKTEQVRISNEINAELNATVIPSRGAMEPMFQHYGIVSGGYTFNDADFDSETSKTRRQQLSIGYANKAATAIVKASVDPATGQPTMTFAEALDKVGVFGDQIPALYLQVKGLENLTHLDTTGLVATGVAAKGKGKTPKGGKP